MRSLLYVSVRVYWTDTIETDSLQYKTPKQIPS